MYRKSAAVRICKPLVTRLSNPAPVLRAARFGNLVGVPFESFFFNPLRLCRELTHACLLQQLQLADWDDRKAGCGGERSHIWDPTYPYGYPYIRYPPYLLRPPNSSTPLSHSQPCASDSVCWLRVRLQVAETRQTLDATRRCPEFGARSPPWLSAQISHTLMYLLYHGLRTDDGALVQVVCLFRRGEWAIQTRQTCQPLH